MNAIEKKAINEIVYNATCHGFRIKVCDDVMHLCLIITSYLDGVRKKTIEISYKEIVEHITERNITREQEEKIWNKFLENNKKLKRFLKNR